MAQKPGLPTGTRDLSPAEVAKRNYIMSVMRHHFECFGYQPIETPSFENAATLLGKYGEEGDRLIFKLLNSGNYLYNKNKIELPDSIEALLANSAETITVDQRIELNRFTAKLSDKALRYDLTVPFARYVVMNQNALAFPFKRYQMQPVWRADKPQKGRYREFYQCDADVVGSTSLWQEVELVQLYDAVFADLGLKGFTIKINNRKILSGIAEVIGASDKMIDFTVALDKLDKIGEVGVKKELREKGISEAALEHVQPLFSFTGSISDKLVQLETLLANSVVGLKGVAEIRFICEQVQALGLKQAYLDLEVTLARGLNYYTGAIFEVAAPKEVQMGSIGGGGRYDDLTGIFGLKNVSGVGISFGLDRIYLVLDELNLFPVTITAAPKILFFNNGDATIIKVMQAVTALRNAGVHADLYPDAAKLDKQFKFAEKRGIPFVVRSIENEMFTVKNLANGESRSMAMEQLKSLTL